jgi:hypothetical protein
MFKARHEMIALGALLVVAVVALVVFEIAHLGHLHFWGKRAAFGCAPTRADSMAAFSKSWQF